jgi:hypothetical protein
MLNIIYFYFKDTVRILQEGIYYLHWFLGNLKIRMELPDWHDMSHP